MVAPLLSDLASGLFARAGVLGDGIADADAAADSLARTDLLVEAAIRAARGGDVAAADALARLAYELAVEASGSLN